MLVTRVASSRRRIRSTEASIPISDMVSAVYNTRVFLLLGQDLLRVMDLMTKQPKKKKKKGRSAGPKFVASDMYGFSQGMNTVTQ